jgi:multidrug resistance efflux pump
MPRHSLPESSSSTSSTRGVGPAKGHGRPINDEALRLESRPSPILPAVLAGSLSVLILGVIGLAATVKIDQIVTVPGKLVTRRSTQELTTPEQGVVKEVLVSNGQAVEKGQALVVLDPRVQTSDVNELERQLVAEGSRQASAQARVRERIAGLERQLQIDQRILEPLQQLAAEGASSKLQMIEKERQLEATRRELAEARQEEQTLSYESQRTQAQLRAALVESRNALDLVTVRAPVAGTVIDLQAQTGQVVNNELSLLKLVPTDDLQAQAFAKDADIAFIRAGQSAEISFASYDKSVYGTLPGQVSLVSQDSLPPDPPYDYPHFPIKIDLSAQVLEHDGKRYELQPGMALQAQIKLQKLTPLQLIFSRYTKTSDAVRTMR